MDLTNGINKIIIYMKQQQSNKNNNSKKTGVRQEGVLTKAQERLVSRLEDLDIDGAVAREIVRDSHPAAIKKWIASLE
jgi:hypothetical protein